MNSKLTVYEKEEDLGSFLLGLQTDAARSQFNEVVSVIEARGVSVTRYNPIHNKDDIPQEIVLPTVYLDDSVLSQGQYPSVEVVAGALGLDIGLFDGIKRTSILHDANNTRIGLCCGVGQDVYLDPNEDDE